MCLKCVCVFALRLIPVPRAFWPRKQKRWKALNNNDNTDDDNNNRDARETPNNNNNEKQTTKWLNGGRKCDATPRPGDPQEKHVNAQEIRESNCKAVDNK